jgi:Protein of unknown function (DUF2806)
MSKSDPLDCETSVSAEVTPNGIKASARSRTIAALDRLGGNFLDQFSTRIEAKTSRERARIEAERGLIEAAGKFGIEQLGKDPAFLDRMLRDMIGTAATKRENKDAVIDYALEDLRNDPPTDEEANTGPETIDENTLYRIEKFAEGATTEQIRERFGKVLATEVRRPGTFSAKTLRIIDELDSEIATFFEKFVENSSSDAVPFCFVGKLSLIDQNKLVEADLIVDASLGQIRFFMDVSDANGSSGWVLEFGKYAVSLKLTAEEISLLKESTTEDAPIFKLNGKPAIPIYLLTQSGKAISSIIKKDGFSTATLLKQKILALYPTLKISICMKIGDMQWNIINE